MTILHIDDDADTRFLVREMLREEAGIGWLEASGVEEALDRHSKVCPDAILLDNRLGGRDGIEWLPQIRARGGCPVWILTGLCRPELAEQAARMGAAGVLSKDELLDRSLTVAALCRPASTARRPGCR